MCINSIYVFLTLSSQHKISKFFSYAIELTDKIFDLKCSLHYCFFFLQNFYYLLTGTRYTYKVYDPFSKENGMYTRPNKMLNGSFQSELEINLATAHF